MKKLFVFFIFFTISAFCFSQDSSKLVSSIDIKGNKIVGLDKIITQIKTRVNQPYNENIISDDIKRIYSLGFFDDISVGLEEEEDTVKVVFTVKEKPVLKKKCPAAPHSGIYAKGAHVRIAPTSSRVFRPRRLNARSGRSGRKALSALVDGKQDTGDTDQKRHQKDIDCLLKKSDRTLIR